MSTELQIAPTPASVEVPDRQYTNHFARNEDILRGIVDGTPVTALCGETMYPHAQGHRSSGGLGTGRVDAVRCGACQSTYDQFLF